MKNTLAYATMVVLLTGCASSQEGAPVAATPTADGPVAVADAAPADEASTGNAYYTVAQARRGDGLFQDNCVGCHSPSEFEGRSFERRWTNRTVGDIYEYVLYTMPDDNPGGLPAQTYADVVAFMLQENDFPAGEAELPTSMDALFEMKMWDD